jgi:hypothetical protein
MQLSLEPESALMQGPALSPGYERVLAFKVFDCWRSALRGLRTDLKIAAAAV